MLFSIEHCVFLEMLLDSIDVYLRLIYIFDTPETLSPGTYTDLEICVEYK